MCVLILNVDDGAICPLVLMLHEMGVIIDGPGLLDTTQVALSLGLKPLPVIVTDVPAGPLFGVRAIFGEVVVTVKVAVAKSPVGLPRTLTVYVPGVAVEATTKLGLFNCPMTEMLHGDTVVIRTGEAGAADIVQATDESAEA